MYCVVLTRNVQIKICSIYRIGVKGIVNKITSVCVRMFLHKVDSTYVQALLFCIQFSGIISQHCFHSERMQIALVDGSIRTGVRCC